MPLRPRSFQEVYDIIKQRVERRYSDADFIEGSYNDLYSGGISLIYQELQAYALDLFRKTWITNPQNTGKDLEDLSIDHYHTGAARPVASRSVGVITITRKNSNSDVINVQVGDIFTTEGKNFVSLEALTILGGSPSGTVILQAEEAGVEGNIDAAQNWSSPIGNVDITNTEPFQGGKEILNDEAYRSFIANFVQSIQEGTAQGLEGTAKLVPGVHSAKVIDKLVDVGTLAPDGTLATGGDLFRFGAIRLLMYLGGETDAPVNSAIRSLVEKNIKAQLSAGEFIRIISAVPKPIDWTVTLTFSSSVESLSLSQRRGELERAFKAAIDDLNVGADFDRMAIANSVLSENNWGGLFTIVTNLPSGEVTIKENEKAVAGTITVNVQ